MYLPGLANVSTFGRISLGENKYLVLSNELIKVELPP